MNNIFFQGVQRKEAKNIISGVMIFVGIVLLNPFSAYAKEKWKEKRSSHFIIYYRDAPESFVKSIEDAAEEYYKEITKNLGFTRSEIWSFDKRAKIYVYADQEDYMTSAKQAGWSHGAANAKKKTIRTFPSAHGFFDSLLPHELGHIIFREFIGFRARIPLWFDEGVAMYQEKAQRWGANKAVKKAMEENHFIPLNELSMLRLTKGTERDIVDLYYAEAASVIYFLITEYGKFKFVTFCRKLKQGQDFNQALSSVYPRFKNMDDINRIWINYLEKQ